jgi:carboxymethylenebutenolidase
MAAMDHLTNADVVDDTAGLLAFIDAQDKASPGPVGCVGHCMSGRYITTVAARFPTRIAAAASMYGVGIVTDEADSPHLLLGEVAGELYYSFAEVDGHVPDQVIVDLRAALAEHGVKNTLEVVPGTQHGYQFAQRAVYAPAQAEAAWDKLFDLWARNLKNTSER